MKQESGTLQYARASEVYSRLKEFASLFTQKRNI